MTSRPALSLLLALCLLSGMTFAAAAQDSREEQLAKQLSNPIASLISVPFQFNYDRGIGPTGDGERVLLNIQPVSSLTESLANKIGHAASVTAVYVQQVPLALLELSASNN